MGAGEAAGMSNSLEGHLHHHQRVSPPPSPMPPPLPGSTATGKAYCRSFPPASPATGVAGRACRLAGTQHLPGSHTVSNPAPTWASIVRDGARANTKPAVSRQDFLALYERCVDSGLRSRIIFHDQAGYHEISISCCLSTPPSEPHAPANVQRHRRKRALAAATASPEPPPVSGASCPTASSPPPDVPSPATITSLPAKQTRKAARSRWEVELLRDSDADDELQLSPISQHRPASFSPASPVFPTPTYTDPSSTPTTPPTMVQPVTPAASPSGTPHSPPAPLTTPSSLPQLVLTAESPEKEVPPRAPAGPPPPPPWNEAFSTDPDRILCWKCYLCYE
jgi:hypothetical protein